MEIAEVRDLLCAELAEGDQFVADHVAHGLIKLGKHWTVEPMIEVLKDGRKHVRKRAADVLSAVTRKKFFWGNQSSAKWEEWWNKNK